VSSKVTATAAFDHPANFHLLTGAQFELESVLFSVHPLDCCTAARRGKGVERDDETPPPRLSHPWTAPDALILDVNIPYSVLCIFKTRCVQDAR